MSQVKENLAKRIETTIPEDLFIQVEPWAKPLLDDLGKFEWGEYGFIVTSDKNELGDEQGWIIREIAAESHYHVGIGLFSEETGVNFKFFVRTGGKTLVSDELTRKSLKKSLELANSSGPTHLAPPGRKFQRKR